MGLVDTNFEIRKSLGGGWYPYEKQVEVLCVCAGFVLCTCRGWLVYMESKNA